MVKQLCVICGKRHHTLPLDVGYHYPPDYFLVPENERTSRIEANRDFCIIDEAHFFIRCYMTIPIQDNDESFGWGVWAKVEEDVILRYAELYTVDGANEPPLDGRLATTLPGYEGTYGLEVAIQLRGAKERPLLLLRPSIHSLVGDQRHGITMERVHDIISTGFPTMLLEGLTVKIAITSH